MITREENINNYANRLFESKNEKNKTSCNMFTPEYTAE